MDEYDYSEIEGIKLDTFQLRPHHVMIRWLKKTETKGGVLLPQTRQRAGLMKGIVLKCGPECHPALKVGVTVEFNGLAEKEFLGVQDPENRDTVFFFRDENVYGVVRRDSEGTPRLDMMHRWVLVKPDKRPEELKGLAMPEQVGDNVRRNSFGWQGEIISVGEMVDVCKPGDYVAYETIASTALKLGDHNAELHVVITDDSVLGHIATVQEGA